MAKPWKFIVILLIVGQLSAQESNRASEAKPPLKAGKIALEYVAAGAAGMALGYLGGMIGAGSGNGWDQLGYAILGVGVGYPLGATTGAWLVGNTQNEQSSFWVVLGGSAIGAGLGFLALTQIDSKVGLYLYAGLVPLGATIGHNLNRRFKTEPGHALLNFKGDQLYWAMPSPVLSWNPRNKNKLSTQFQIISISL